MSETKLPTKGSDEELAVMEQQLAESAIALAQTRRALQRAEALGRIRDQIIALRRLEEVPEARGSAVGWD